MRLDLGGTPLPMTSEEFLVPATPSTSRVSTRRPASPEYWLVDEHPSNPMDGIVQIFRLALTHSGPQYLLDRKVEVSALMTA